MVKVGINENVMLDGVELNDKKHLILSFREKTETSLFEELSASDVSDGETATHIRLFPFKVPDKKDLTDRQKQDRIIEEIKSKRNVMLHFLLNFYAKADVNLDTYKGTGINKDTKQAEFMAKHLSQNMLDKIWTNLVVEFRRLSLGLVQLEGSEFRLKLRRQSKEKHFPSLPDKFLESRPFIEPMSVDKESSRVRFDEYELAEGLDNPNPTPQSAADRPPEGEGSEQDNMFAETPDDTMFNPNVNGDAGNI